MVKSARAATPPRTVAVVGAGWAGCAAAVALSRAGHQVTLFESARIAGGRARRVALGERSLDNGQHIMLGAYSATLQLMKQVGVDADQALLKLPLQMRYPPDSGGMDFHAPRWPAPLHLLGALLRATGLHGEDKMSLARFSTTARWMGWQLHQDCSVAELLERFDQTPRLIQLMWRPLCLAALNTPPERASAQVFLNVLRDSLGARRAASDMLIPRADLSALLPEAAIRFIQRHGAAVHLGAKVDAVVRANAGWELSASGESLGGTWNGRFDGVVLAMPASQTARLLDGHAGADALRATLDAFQYEAITTCYLQYAEDLRLDLPFYALLDTPAQGHWGQFVFDRGQLDLAQAGLLAVVISASAQAAELGHDALAQVVARQLAAVLKLPALENPLWHKCITEKRATFACTPGLVRPGNQTPLNGLVIAGDYTACDYPATLEAAVRSGFQAATALRESAF